LYEEKCVCISGFDLSDQKEFRYRPRECKVIERKNRELADEELREAYRLLQEQAEEMEVQTENLQERSEELQKANEAMRESEKKFRNIVETANEGISLISGEGIVTYVNKKMADMLGYTIGEVIGRPVWDFVGKENESTIKMNVEKRRRGINENYDIKLTCKDGSPLWVLINSKSFFDGSHKFVGSLSMLTDITERKKTEKALHESETRFRALAENSPDIITRFDRQHRHIYANPASVESYNISLDDIIGKTQGELGRAPKKVKLWEERLENAFVTGKTETMEYNYVSPQGIKQYFNTKIVPEFVDGKVVSVLAISRDITDIRKAESKLKEILDNLENLVKERTTELEKAYNSLKESENNLTEAQKIAHIGNWDWNIVTGEVFWSDELYRIFGRSHKESGATYHEFLNFVHSDYQERVDNAVKKGFTGEPIEGDIKITLANGEERLVYIRAEIIFDEKNNPIRIKGIVQDITERKKAEEGLRESEEKYRSIVETANEGIVIIDDEFRATYVNKKLLDMVGYSLEECINKPIWDFISEDCRSIVKLNQEKRRQGISESYEFKLICKNGSPLWVLSNAKSLFDKNGEFIGSLSMLTDITKRKEVEKALANFEIAREKEIHHRIKNNLQVVSSLLDLQAYKFKGRDDIKDSEMIEAFTESQIRVRSIALIHEELYKGSGFETLNFSEYVERLVSNLLSAYKLGDTEIGFTKDLEENLILDMDTAIPLGTIINELVSNSFKHAFPGRDKGEIRIKLHREENGDFLKISEGSKSEDHKSINFILSVSDNGVGIPENFDIEKLDSLGLYLVTSLVEQLDGDLEIKRNNGTEFIIRFVVTEKNNKASAQVQNTYNESPKFSH
jgi:PAS domain S-box-containing protein